MKKIMTTIFIALLFALTAKADNKGVPFFRNFTPQNYNAHNRNYDIGCDDHGTVFVANFEGLLYYDGSTWRKIHTPGISRVTRLARGNNGRIWVGGYKVFGYVEPDEIGRLQLHTIINDTKKTSFNEVDMIKVTPRRVYVHTIDGKAYYVRGDKELVPLRTIKAETIMQSSSDSIFNIKIGNHVLSMPKSGGVNIFDGKKSRTITHEDGLCSNSINFITHNKRRTLWAATEHGIFAMEVPSLYTHITEDQGLLGDVYSLGMLNNALYIGTLQGLFALDDGKLSKVSNISFACWQIIKKGKDALVAATSEGLFLITKQAVKRITDANTLAVLNDGKGGYYTGDLDAIYRVSPNGQRSKLAKIEKVTKLSFEKGKLRAETIYGEVWLVNLDATNSKACIRSSEDVNEPKLDVIDEMGRRWTTNYEGKAISMVSNDVNSALIKKWIKPLGEMTLNAIYCTSGNSLWVGGDFGVINCDLSHVDRADKAMIKKKPLYIREITTAGDSVLWGGYSVGTMKPVSNVDDIEIPFSMRQVTIHYSSDINSIFSPAKYRHRINGGKWSKWSVETDVHFSNMAPGKMVFEVQSMDMLGNLSDMARATVTVGAPLYLQWWAILLYLLILYIIVMLYMNYKEKKLKRNNEQLEKIVSERTAELSEKTAELSTALDDLQRTQADLVRMERTATAGKLTQGLIDRILNPINYINNFAKLTRGLAKDLQEDIEDDKENMTEDIYDDCEDVLDMMTQNLGKIEEHGVNTTRTLRAMEAMLNTHIGNIRPTDIKALIKQVASVASEYHKETISKCNISIITELPDEEIQHEVDPDSINNALLALITNSVYAVSKKYQRCPYGAEIKMKLKSIAGKHVDIHVTDNGIGIEDTIIDKVFDPFFTTKTTGEAAGVGLYLAREIIQDHNGTISIKSEKDQYTEITINL
ncbi:MAG: HAMP domain-containing histidine kinase [Prevotella sp.]|nr:HAMP domain-containing histidine kinase [Candidatus Prevotella equi]